MTRPSILAALALVLGSVALRPGPGVVYVVVGGERPRAASTAIELAQSAAEDYAQRDAICWCIRNRWDVALSTPPPTAAPHPTVLVVF